MQRARDELEQRVTERTRDLYAATERFKALFDHAPVAMLMVDRDGAIRQTNVAAERVFEASPGGLLGERVEALLPDALRSRHPKLREAYVHEPVARPMGEGRELYAQRKSGEHFPVEIGLNPLPGEVSPAVIASIVDISARKKAEERVQFIMRELSHRTKNLLAVIQGMVRQALASSPDLQTFEHSFSERLQGLARSHDLLVGKDWQGVAIADLVRAQLAFLKRGDASSVVVGGPDTVLTPEAAQSLGLALHELATNAAKHGALSTDTGTIAVSWQVRNEARGGVLAFSWEEANGPTVSKPERKGFGRTVLERVVPGSLGGSGTLVFSAGGLRWQLEVPLEATTLQAGRSAAA